MTSLWTTTASPPSRFRIPSSAPSPRRSPEVLERAAREIRYKPIAIYGLLVKKEKRIHALYIYYRDRAFHRVGEPKNAGLVVNPPDTTPC